MTTRRPISAAPFRDPDGDLCVFVIADDGTMWTCYRDEMLDWGGWRPVPPLPDSRPEGTES